MSRLETAIEPADVTPILLRALELIRARAVENLRTMGVKEKTGTLINFMMTRATKSTKFAGAWLKADAVQETGASNAKHAHLIEYGHVMWRGGKRKDGRGHQIGLGKGKGKSRKFPFFRTAIAQTKGAAISEVEEGIRKLIERFTARY